MTGGFQAPIQICQHSDLDGNVQTVPLCLIVDFPLVEDENLLVSLHHCLYSIFLPQTFILFRSSVKL